MDDATRAVRAARRYRELGLSPLPSVHSGDRKRPMLANYAVHQSSPLGDDYFESAESWGTPNTQLMCGVKAYGATRIAVVDCDGDAAISRFEAICRSNGFETSDTWRVITGGEGGGMHCYFLLPAGTESVQSGLIWGLWDTYGSEGRGAWAKHQEVRILGDGSLAVAPPSLHLITGRRYAFFDADPVSMPLPAVAPDWLLAMPRLSKPRFESALTPPRKIDTPGKGPGRAYTGFADRNTVLAAIADKVALAASWGLRFARHEPNSAGWCSCHAAGREDRSPSASFQAATGCYQDRKDLATVSLFDLGVILQPAAFADWKACMEFCRSQYCESRTPYAQALAYPPAN